MKNTTLGLFLAAFVLVLLTSSQAGAADYAVTFTKLTGDIGGSPALTAVYRADLSGLPIASILSISIKDSSAGLGGSGGKFSGFDLDAIKLINTSYSAAADVSSAVGLGVFNFSPAGTIFTPGTQRPPADPALFGTLGGNIDNSVATLGFFDGNATTVIPGAFGFVSMGDGGIASFNLTSSVSTANLFLYIGEVGDNGEVAGGNITVSDTPVPPVPEPSAILLALGGLGTLLKIRRRK